MSAALIDIVHARGVSPIDKCDALTREWRELAWDYGLSVAQSFLLAGISAAQARHLICAVHRGAREPGNKRPISASAPEIAIDQFLLDTGSSATARMLMRRVRDEHWAFVPLTPTRRMLVASMTVVHGGPRIDTEDKHRRRLVAATKASMAEVMGP